MAARAAGKPLPVPGPQTGLRALQAMLRERHPLAALQVFHAELGDVFRINLPGFRPVMLVGPQAARFVLVQGRDDLRWRNERDPVVSLLRHGVLVEDGPEHDQLRRVMNPALHRSMLSGYVDEIALRTQQVLANWPNGGRVDMLVEMRKIALLALMHTLYRVDYSPRLQELWSAVLGNIGYISPGLWMVWPGAPRLGYRRALAQIDHYLYAIIAERRVLLAQADAPAGDLLGLLLQAGLDDDLVRDQLLTMLIAGHDTVTALMAWALYLIGSHPQVYARLQAEVDAALPQPPPLIAAAGPVTLHSAAADATAMLPLALQQLGYLDQVIKESLRLYPPIHLGSRRAAVDLEYDGYHIPAGERVIYSIYLTQRHPAYWPDPQRFDPQRHAPGQRPAAYTWLAFGGGPRNCIGAAFGQVEAAVVLALVLRQFELRLVGPAVRPHMGATLEPHPGVMMQVQRRD